MKRMNLVWKLAMIVVAVLISSVSFGVAGAVFATAGVIIADAPVTSETMRAENPTLNMEDISATVTEMLPARVPLNKIMREIRKSKKADSEVLRYYSVISKALYDIPNASASGNGTSSGASAKSYAFASGEGLAVFFLQVTNPDLWRTDDTFIMRDLSVDATVAVSPTGKTDVVFWVKKKDGNILTIVPLNGCKGTGSLAAKYVMPNFASTVKLYRAGAAKASTAMQTAPFGIAPTPEEQFCQNFMAQIEEATFQKLTKKEVNWGFADYERQNIYSMTAEQEMSFLWGIKSELYNSDDSTTRLTTEGILRRIQTQLEYGTGGSNRTVSQDNYLTWLKTVFSGNSGSDTRVLFAGSNLMKNLHLIDEYSKQIDGKNPVVKWGVRFQEIVSDFGTVLVSQHPIFTETGWADNGVIFDMDKIEKHDFVPMKVTELDLIGSGQRNVTAKVIQEVSALTLTYPDCHAIIKPKA